MRGLTSACMLLVACANPGEIVEPSNDDTTDDIAETGEDTGDRVRRGFVRPATHGSSTTGGTNAPPYGVHLRLRADFPVDSLPTAGAKVVARALQKYGMYHADGGQVALTAQSDRHTTAKWSGVLGPQDLVALKVNDFEVIDHGAMIPLTYACNR